MGNILEGITNPGKIQKLNNNKIEKLAKDIRKFLIDNVSKSGGHLASNLGVVELTLALFKNFNFEEDRIIWDVGHQSYVYKMLTGRKNKFSTLRQFDGLSGFPKRAESKYDYFDTGHSSTSLSAASGMARARDILGKDYNVVAVIGDGALTGGMAIEALNDIGYNKSKVIIILNDNQMSISKNVGGMAAYLSNARLNPKYNKMKLEINSTLNTTDVGKNIAVSLNKIKGSIKRLVVPSMLFEDMGIKCLGPIDGHNIKELSQVIAKAKQAEGPIMIHVVTKKGKGCDYAEKNPDKYHGIGPFDHNNGKIKTVSGKNYSKVFGETLISLAKEHKDIVAITAAMPDGTGLKDFSTQFPKRFFDVGIAEEHGMTLAAGMAVEGLKPFFAVYSTFLQRAYDQVIHDICIQKLPVKICIDRAGIVGEDGETHQGIFDISFLNAVPNLTIVAPKCMEELPLIMKWSLSYNKPLAIRYPRGGDIKDLPLEPLKEIKYGKWENVRRGDKIAVIATGKMMQHAIIACEDIKKELNIDINLINATFIKPIDKELLKEIADNKESIITIEDNTIVGGLGSVISQELNNLNYKGKVINLGYKDKFIPHGKVSILYEINKLDSKGIKETIISLL